MLLTGSGLCLWLCSQPSLRALAAPAGALQPPGPAAPWLSPPGSPCLGSGTQGPGHSGEEESWEAQLKGGMCFVLEAGVRCPWCRTLLRLSAEWQLRGDTTLSFLCRHGTSFHPTHTSIKSFPG